MILSLQGCMAVGKTTAVNYLVQNAPYMHISYEVNRDIIDEIKRRQLDKNKYDDYLEIQKCGLIKKWLIGMKLSNFHAAWMDFGAEEIEFYTLNYPKSIGVEWEIENALHTELDAVRKCMPTRILFLDASDEVLRMHKENDATRSRNFLEHHLKYLLPLKRKWFFGRTNVDILHVDDLDIETVGIRVKEWCDKCIADFDENKLR